MEYIADLWDWHYFFERWNFTTHGIAILQKGEHVNHAWRLLRRADLKDYLVNSRPYLWDVFSASHYSI